MEYPHLFKRYSYVWQDLIQQSVMCDYISHDSIGLGGLKAMRSYFIKQETSVFKEPNRHHKEAELDGLCTVCTIFAPSFLPTCAVIYEEGCSFLKGRNRKELLCCTPSTFIRSEFTALQCMLQNFYGQNLLLFLTFLWCLYLQTSPRNRSG